MSQRIQEYDLPQTLREAGVSEADNATLAMADRMLQIHQGDPKKAGRALKEWLGRQQ